MQLSLEGKNALVCGSTQGIGHAIAVELASLGCQVTLLARNEEKLQELVTELPQPLDQVHHYLVANFDDTAEVSRVVSKDVAAQIERPYHILINNTGGPDAGAITEAQAEDFLQAYQQHLLCNHLLMQALLPGMKTANYGRIINIVSTSVRIPLEGLGVSNTTRAAVAGWAKTLSNEVARFNITVNNILPGFTETQRLLQIIEERARLADVPIPEMVARMEATVPVGRFGRPEEIAAVAAFLASPSASYINGTSIPVDGGRTGSI